MSELSDDQVAELLAWAKHMRGIYEKQTPWQQDLLRRLVEAIGHLPDGHRENTAHLVGEILRTIVTFHEGFKQAPLFVQGVNDEKE